MVAQGPKITDVPPSAAPLRRKLAAVVKTAGSQSALARQTGIPQSRISSWMRGADSPRLTALRILAAATDTPICYWADDGWGVEENPCEVATCPRVGCSYAEGKTDGGQVSDGRGAGWAAEAVSRVDAISGPGSEARVLAALAVEVARAGLEHGQTWEAIEQALAPVLQPVLEEIVRPRTA